MREHKKLITVKEFSALYGIGLNSAYNIVRSKGFPCIKVGRKYLILMDQVDSFFDKHIGNIF